MADFDFDNSYARLGAAFYQPTVPSPVTAPHLLKLNRRLAEELGLDADQLDNAEGVEIFAGNRLPAGAEPIAAAYGRTSIRKLRAATWRWARHSARRGRRPTGAASRHSTERGWPHLLLAQRRRTGSTRPGPARVSRQRGHGRARHSNHAGAGRGRDGRASLPGNSPAGRGPHAGRLQPYTRRHVPVLRGTGRRRCGSPTCRPL